VSTDKRSGITNDRNARSTPHPNPLPGRGGEGTEPNRPDDPEYIVRLLGQGITVSLETVKVVKGLPTLEKVDAL